MAITSITYHCPDVSMGADEQKVAKAAGYRSWVKAQIEAQFPGASVTVTNQYQARNIETNAHPNDEEDSANVLRLMLFITEAWESCPWNW